MNGIVEVKLVDGTKETNEFSDYFVQDGILTVYRDKQIKIDRFIYPPFEMHFSMEKVMYIKCVKTR